jgi:hypothetical protein
LLRLLLGFLRAAGYREQVGPRHCRSATIRLILTVSMSYVRAGNALLQVMLCIVSTLEVRRDDRCHGRNACTIDFLKPGSGDSRNKAY